MPLRRTSIKLVQQPTRRKVSVGPFVGKINTNQQIKNTY